MSFIIPAHTLDREQLVELSEIAGKTCLSEFFTIRFYGLVFSEDSNSYFKVKVQSVVCSGCFYIKSNYLYKLLNLNSDFFPKEYVFYQFNKKYSRFGMELLGDEKSFAPVEKECLIKASIVCEGNVISVLWDVISSCVDREYLSPIKRTWPHHFKFPTEIKLCSTYITIHEFNNLSDEDMLFLDWRVT